MSSFFDDFVNRVSRENKKLIYEVLGHSFPEAQRKGTHEVVRKLAEIGLSDRQLSVAVNQIWSKSQHMVVNGELVCERMRIEAEYELVASFIEIRDRPHGHDDHANLLEAWVGYPDDCSLLLKHYREIQKLHDGIRSGASVPASEHFLEWYKLCMFADTIVSPQRQGRNAFVKGRSRGSCPFSVNPRLQGEAAEVLVETQRAAWFDGYDTEEMYRLHLRRAMA